MLHAQPFLEARITIVKSVLREAVGGERFNYLRMYEELGTAPFEVA